MFSNNLELIQQTYSISNAEIARSGDLSESQISRIRSNKTATKEGQKSHLLICRGILSILKSRNLTESAASWLGLSADFNEDDLLRVLDKPESIGDLPADQKAIINNKDFCKKLSALMKLSGASNKSMGKAIAVSEATFSRIRSGKRTLAGPEYSIRICITLMDGIILRNKENELTDLIGISEKDLIKDPIGILHEYLFNKPAMENWHSVDLFVSSMLRVSRMSKTLLKADNNFLIPSFSKKPEYSGTVGLQEAVIRFLSVAAEKGGTLNLYSDQSMKWMEGDFMNVWAMLMKRAVSCGVRIRIIHNLKRDIPTLFTAIEAWLPLYFSGCIESFYIAETNESVFSHTLFIHEDVSVVESFESGNDFDKFRFHYFTSKDEITHRMNSFNGLLSSSRPLAMLYNKSIKKFHWRSNDLGICFNEDSVYVTDINHSGITFCFSHHMMVDAFKAYILV